MKFYDSAGNACAACKANRWNPKFGKTPMDLGVCEPTDFVTILLKHPHNGKYFFYGYKVEAQFYNWLETEPPFRIYGFRVFKNGLSVIGQPVVLKGKEWK